MLASIARAEIVSLPHHASGKALSLLARNGYLRLVAGGVDVDAGAVHKFLLTPFFLFDDLASALIPGVLFLLLSLTAHVAAVENFFAMPYLGYKTKIGAGLLLGYVVGKIFQLPSAIALNVVENLQGGEFVQAKINQNAPPADALVGRGRNVLVGFIMGLIFPPLNAFDMWVITRAKVGFYLNSGLVLLVASLFSPTHTLAIIERCAGTAFLLMGAASAARLRRNVPILLGWAIGSNVVSSPESFEHKFKTALVHVFGKAISTIRTEYSPPASPAPKADTLPTQP